MVTLEVPIAAVAPAARVTVVEATSGFGLKDAVTPLGSPEARESDVSGETVPRRDGDGAEAGSSLHNGQASR